MASTMNHALTLRLLSALILMPFVLGAVVYGGPVFLVMIGVAMGLSFKEWGQMAVKGGVGLATHILGFAYIIVCCVSFAYLRQHFPGGAGLCLCLLLGIWASDTGAYFAGKTFGGPKLAPQISPSKTWAGLFGGMLASAFSFVVFASYLGPFLTQSIGVDFEILNEWHLWAIAAIGAFITLTGQAGDLLESFYKRKAGVKDSGTLIPGHGGLLDRIDSLLMSAPLFLLFLVALS